MGNEMAEQQHSTELIKSHGKNQESGRISYEVFGTESQICWLMAPLQRRCWNFWRLPGSSFLALFLSFSR